MSTSDARRLLLMGGRLDYHLQHLQSALSPAWTVEIWREAEGVQALRDALGRADAMIVGPEALLAGVFHRNVEAAIGLKLLQIPFAGYEWLDPALLPKGCLVCNAAGHEPAIAEFVLGALLNWEIRFAILDAEFRAGSWRRRGIGDTGLYQGEIGGKILGIVGYGGIGRALAKRSRAFGLKVIAVSRSERTIPEDLDAYATMEGLNGLLGESDYVVLTVSLTAETRGLIGGKALAAMKPEAVLVNVARGEVVDEEALYTALNERRIGGAILDVWYAYPPGDDPMPVTGGPAPSRFDFAGLDNVLMTPHCAAHTWRSERRRLESIVSNLNAFAKGERPPCLALTA